MCRRRAAVEPMRRTRQAEVPVRANRVPRRAAVLCLEHFLETDEHVIRVGRVDGEELVVPGLHAGVIALAELQRGARVRELAPLSDFVPRTAEAAVGLVDALEDR